MGGLIALPPGALLEHGLAFVGALLVALLATGVVRSVAPRLDFVSRPKGERHSLRPVALGGGVALFVALAPGLWHVSPDLLAGAAVVFVLGLVDDRRALSPPTKLVVQTAAASLVVAGPLARAGLGGPPALAPLGPEALAIPLTIALLVGAANSVNLLDNMDGSAAGVSAVAAAFLYVLAAGGTAPDPVLAAGAAIACGACLGFLAHNAPPARVFMGDAGSLLLGFVLAGLALRIPPAEGAGPIARLAVIAFVLGAPLFDTTLVWFTRRRVYRPFLQGGRDHTTHRLLALGLSERRALAVVWGLAAASGGVAVAIARGGVGAAVVVGIAGGVVLVLVGVFLGRVAVYRGPEGAPLPERPARPALAFGLELAFDVATLSAAWIGAYVLRFEDRHLPFYLGASALPALPWVIGLKVPVLLALGLYRGLWPTIRAADVLRIVQATALGSLLVAVAATLLVRFEHFSRGVFAIDLLLSTLAVLGSRAGLRLLRDALARLSDRPRRAALLGRAGAAWLEPHVLAEALGASRLEHALTLLGTPDGARAGAEAPARVGPEGLVAAARAADVAVVVLGPGWREDDPRVAALRAAGFELRRLRAVLE